MVFCPSNTPRQGEGKMTADMRPLLVIIVALPLVANAQPTSIAVVPKPVSVAAADGAFALNANTRIVGLFGDEIIAQELVNAFPRLEWKVSRRGNEITRYRAETRISPERDRLFSW